MVLAWAYCRAALQITFEEVWPSLGFPTDLAFLYFAWRSWPDGSRCSLCHWLTRNEARSHQGDVASKNLGVRELIEAVFSIVLGH